MAAQSSPIKSSARDAEPAERPSLTLKRRLNAAPEKVYAAWADPQKLVQWFGPGSVEEGSVKAENDLRVGGRYRIRFNAKGKYNEVGGVYREVVPNKRLVFSWAWHSTPERKSLVTMSLKPEGGGTLLTFLHEQFADATAHDNHERGSTGIPWQTRKLSGLNEGTPEQIRSGATRWTGCGYVTNTGRSQFRHPVVMLSRH